MGQTLSHEQVKSFAEAAASEFGVGEDRSVSFDKKLALQDIKGTEERWKGEVVSLDPAQKTFKLNLGKKQDPAEVEVVTGENDVRQGFEQLELRSRGRAGCQARRGDGRRRRDQGGQ